MYTKHTLFLYFFFLIFQKKIIYFYIKNKINKTEKQTNKNMLNKAKHKTRLTQNSKEKHVRNANKNKKIERKSIESLGALFPSTPWRNLLGSKDLGFMYLES